MTGGELIRSARKRLGWTQAELAEKVGLQREDVSKIETGYIGLGDDRAAMFAAVSELSLTATELLPPQAETTAFANLRREVAALRARVRTLEAQLQETDGIAPPSLEKSRSRGG